MVAEPGTLGGSRLHSDLAATLRPRGVDRGELSGIQYGPQELADLPTTGTVTGNTRPGAAGSRSTCTWVAGTGMV